jgi:acyl-CoA thioester hydrolase
MSKPNPPSRDAFKKFIAMPTRWADNDLYGHVNNVTYYSYFDTAVNQWLIDAGLLKLNVADEARPLGLVVANSCQYFSSIAFPQQLEIGLRVDHIGNSSVRYALAVFSATEPLAAALGEFTHVYVHRTSRKPIALPETWRTQLLTLTF